MCGFENVMAMTICMMKPGIAFCLDCVNWFFIGGGRFLSHPGCVQSLRRHNLHLEVQLGILPQFNIGASLEEHNFFVPGVVLISSRSFTCFRKPLCWITFSIMIHFWLSLRCTSAFYTSAYYHTECTGVNEFMWCNAPVLMHSTCENSLGELLACQRPLGLVQYWSR